MDPTHPAVGTGEGSVFYDVGTATGQWKTRWRLRQKNKAARGRTAAEWPLKGRESALDAKAEETRGKDGVIDTKAVETVSLLLSPTRYPSVPKP